MNNQINNDFIGAILTQPQTEYQITGNSRYNGEKFASLEVARELCNEVIRSGYTARIIDANTGEIIDQTESIRELSYKWARHVGINYYHARADIEAIITGIGENNARDYIALKLSGDTVTSLNAFSNSRGFDVQWHLIW